MNMIDIIVKKRDGGTLSRDEIYYMIDEYIKGSIPDYQMSAMCMAILFRGMTEQETLDLTMAMMNSGNVIKLNGVNGVTADKHSTGGVGDKTSLVLCPMVAACGVKIAKMSGRGLGHTGGTIDKLESFPGFSTSLDEDKFYENVNKYGIAIMGQTENIDPADKKMYALRDVTGTVPSIPLIASSIMSKKLAAGADVIVLDVKCGDGAFMKTKEDAEKLAEAMTKIGSGAGRKCAAVISNMEQPLGHAIGNAIEVREAIATLKGEMDSDLLEVCYTLGKYMLKLGGLAPSLESAEAKLRESIRSGKALEKLADMVEAQGGKRSDVYDPSGLPNANLIYPVRAEKVGYVKHIAAEKVGLVSMHLGGGRVTKTSAIDLSVGIYLHKKVGALVKPGDIIADVHAADEVSAKKAAEELLDCYVFSSERVEAADTIVEVIDFNGGK